MRPILTFGLTFLLALTILGWGATRAAAQDTTTAQDTTAAEEAPAGTAAEATADAAPEEAAADEAAADDAAADEAAAGEAAADDAAPDAAPADEAADQPPVSFKNDIAPILVAKCLACHGANDPQGEYQLNHYAQAITGGYSGSPIVTPGEPEASELYNLVRESDADLRMPKEGDPLAEAQIDLIGRWIAEGARFDGDDPQAALASIIPGRVHPAAPETYRAPLPVTALAFHPGGELLASSGYHEVLVWNTADGALQQRIGNLAQRTYGLAYSPDGRWLAVASGDPGQLGEVKLFDAASGAAVRTLGSFADVALGVAFNPDGTRLAACGADRSIRVYDVASGDEQLLIEDHADWVLAVAWNSDGSHLASASRDKTSKLFNASNGEAHATYNGHGDAALGVAFNADGTQVWTASADRQLHIWNPAEGNRVAVIGGYGHEVFRVLVAGGHVYSCSADHTLRRHDAADRKQLSRYEGHHDWVYALAWHEPTGRLASGSYDGEIRLWNAEEGSTLLAFPASPQLPATSSAAVASPDAPADEQPE